MFAKDIGLEQDSLSSNNWYVCSNFAGDAKQATLLVLYHLHARSNDINGVHSLVVKNVRGGMFS